MTSNEWLIVLRSIVRVMQDSTRIADIHRVAEITCRHRFRSLLDDARAGGREPELLQQRPRISPESVDLDSLRQLPDSTLGGAYVRHLDAHGLEIFVAPVPPDHVPDPELRYLIHRYRQVHDIWHVLLALGTHGHEEVLVHAFVLGHLRLPVSALIVLFGTLKHVVLERRWWVLRRALYEAFSCGRAASPLLLVPWEQMWSKPLSELRSRYGIRPILAPDPLAAGRA